MLQLDLIGLVLTIFVLGPQNILYTVLAILVHELGKIIALTFLTPQVETVVTGGILNTTIFKTAEPVLVSLVVTLAGPFFCLFMGLMFLGVNFKSFSPKQLGKLFNPFIRLERPWAAINLRLAFLSALISIIGLLDLKY